MNEPENPIDISLEPLAEDGERFLPDRMGGEIELEHLHRYRFAAQLVRKKVVLDVASGEGYGTAYLSAFARYAIGVDISIKAVAHAQRKYKNDNLEYLVGTCSAIPLENGAVDVVVSFETIEHHSEHEAMMCEIKRVLRPGGVLIISSPNKLEYSDRRSFHNPFHVKELYFDEYQSLLSTYFTNVQFYAQRVLLGSVIIRQREPRKILFDKLGSVEAPESALPMPIYWIALASDKKLPSTSGGILEKPLAEILQSIARQSNAEIAKLVQLVAKPDSKNLRDQFARYLELNADVAQSGIDPYEHWINHGIYEGRIPGSDTITLVRDLLLEREQDLRVALAEKECKLCDVEVSWSEHVSVRNQQFEKEKAVLKLQIESLIGSLQVVEQQKRWQLAGHEQEASIARKYYVDREEELQKMLLACRAELNVLKAKCAAITISHSEQVMAIKNDGIAMQSQLQEKIHAAERAAYQYQNTISVLQSEVNELKTRLPWRMVSLIRKYLKR